MMDGQRVRELIAAHPRVLADQCAIGTGGRIVAGQDDAGEEPSGVPSCLDYGRSFICNTADFNSVRFWVESRTTIFDAEAGVSTEFYQCGSCKSEHTFAEKDLFHEDNYDFLPILGDDHWLVFRRPAGLSERYRTIEPVDKYWGKPILKLRRAEGRRRRRRGWSRYVDPGVAWRAPPNARRPVAIPLN